jgi:hypothetical protein
VRDRSSDARRHLVGRSEHRDDDGRHKRRTQAEVRAKLDEIRERLDAGAPIKDAKMTFAA